METLPHFPTFTIPTHRCCSLLLKFDEIAEILDQKPHLVQVGIGELERNSHLVSLGVNWLFSPVGWPVYLTGFNPGVPRDGPQVFQFDVVKKRMQFSNGQARTSMSYPDICALASNASIPSVSVLCMPCEEESDVEESDEGKKNGGTKKQRKKDRRNLSVSESLNTITASDASVQFVVPLNSGVNPAVLEKCSAVEQVVGFSSRGIRDSAAGRKKFSQIPNKGELSDILRSIVSALEGGADVVETDFPFNAAKMGVFLNPQFELEDMKDSKMFSANEPLQAFPVGGDKTPAFVVEAGAHHKSYIHHLFRCEELSGPVLLAAVNLFNFSKLFAKYRKD